MGKRAFLLSISTPALLYGLLYCRSSETMKKRVFLTVMDFMMCTGFIFFFINKQTALFSLNKDNLVCDL